MTTTKTNNHKIYNGIMLGIHLWAFMGLATYGLYKLLQTWQGDVYWFIPILGMAGLVAFTYERYKYYKCSMQ